MTASFKSVGIAPAVTASALKNQLQTHAPNLATRKKKKDNKSQETSQLTLIRPPIVPQIAPPAPKQPTLLLLIRDNLRRKPPAVPPNMLTRRREPRARIELDIIRNAEAEFAHYRGCVAAAVVVAGEVEVGGRGLVGAGDVDVGVVCVLEVAVVVVGGEGGVGEVLLRGARVPFCVLGWGLGVLVGGGMGGEGEGGGRLYHHFNV